MAIPDLPPDPTYCQILLADPEASDAAELQRLLEDCGLRVLRIDELPQAELELRTKEPKRKLSCWSMKSAKRDESRADR